MFAAEASCQWHSHLVVFVVLVVFGYDELSIVSCTVVSWSSLYVAVDLSLQFVVER